MTEQTARTPDTEAGLSEEELQALVDASDSGARNPHGGVGIMLAIVAVTWSMFQVLLASPIANYVLSGALINNSRQIHLAFAIILVFLAYPAVAGNINLRSQAARLGVWIAIAALGAGVTVLTGNAAAQLDPGVAAGALTILNIVFSIVAMISAAMVFVQLSRWIGVALFIAAVAAANGFVPSFENWSDIRMAFGMGLGFAILVSVFSMIEGLGAARASVSRIIGVVCAGLILAVLFYLSVTALMPAMGTVLWAVCIIVSMLIFALILVVEFTGRVDTDGDVVPLLDWMLIGAGAFVALYGVINYDKLVASGGLADDVDKWFALAGLVLLFEAARRALGPAMALIATFFLGYVFFGSAEMVPEVIQWKGASLKKAMSHMWITTEGVFGIALGVSTKFVFLFVLFGALLDKAGAGNYFIKMAFGALGHLRGGPAKAAVVGSAATGLISGSSIANVVTTGTFTIPLMKRVGFTSEKGGAVEVASSVNGQIMPPVMGAAAFLMVEYVGISYVEVITHAFLPAAISYIALVYIVHLEAVKNNMPTIGDREVDLVKTIFGMFTFFAVFAGLCYGSQFPVDAIETWVPSIAGLVTFGILLAIYVGLVKLASGIPDLEPDDPNAAEVELPVISEIYKAGLYYLLPIVVLVYFLMIEQKSPGLSAFWATGLLFIILLTQRPLKSIFRGENDMANSLMAGVHDLWDGMVSGARNMIGIGLATATAGVIVGTVTLTGIGQVMADLVEVMAYGLTYILASLVHLISPLTDIIGLTAFEGSIAERAADMTGTMLVMVLLCVGLLSLVLGMGLPTTANYIVVSSLMAGVVVQLGAESGLIVPLIAVHLFVFYFGIMADVTPPVGLASFAAAAVSGGDAIKTGFTAFFYSLRTVALPFVFIFNTDLLLIGVSWQQGIIVFVAATIGILVFTAGTMGWYMTRNRIYESLLLVLIAFAMFRPDYFQDRIQPPFEQAQPTAFAEALGGLDDGQNLTVIVSGPDYDTGEIKQKTIIVEPKGASPEEKLAATGLFMEAQGDKMVMVEEPDFSSPHASLSNSFDFYGDTPVEVASVQVPVKQFAKELLYIPALALLALLTLAQMARARSSSGRDEDAHNQKGEVA